MKALILCSFLVLPLHAQQDITAKAATHFLATLNEEQKAKAALPMTSEERENFGYTPHERAGLPLKEMSQDQRSAAMKLLSSALSEKGNLKASQIIALEEILGKLENNPVRRDHEKYYATIFGKPGDPNGWAWRFEGHHLAVHITVVAGKGASVTPTFFGSNPAEVKDGPQKGLRVLAGEEDLGLSLAASLVESGKNAVIFSQKPPSEILTGEERQVKALDPVGILASEMSESQQTALRNLIAEYTGRYRPEIAETDLAKIEKAGLGKIRFGWAGGLNRGDACYYRIQGPTFLMEMANTQNNATTSTPHGGIATATLAVIY
ncbi:MAG: DUF3500 domain-containing protein [Akkermansiaceae bacterium]|nr:DUF3500 domain-containing protein [Akkermansiaceae bacterium]